MTASVAWGVTSRGVRPVPPVVMTSGWCEAPALSAPSIAGRSSLTSSALDGEAELLEAPCDAGAGVSSRSPAALRSLAVSTSADRPLIPDPASSGRSCRPHGRPASGGRRPCVVGGTMPVAALAAGLGHEPDGADLDALLDALDHVVDRRAPRRTPPWNSISTPVRRSSRPRRGRGAPRRPGPA